MLAFQGWEIDGEKHVNDNSAEHSLSLYTPDLSIAKVREVNIFFVQTPEHYI